MKKMKRLRKITWIMLLFFAFDFIPKGFALAGNSIQKNK
jgi:hypothetical protein